MGWNICRISAVVIVAAASGAGCFHDSSNYCAAALNNNCLNVDAAIPRCTGDQECTEPGATVCDLVTAACVRCTPAEPASCTGTAPVCGTDDACHSCTAHAQCASQVCLPDGSCGDDTNVAYVALSGTDNDVCTKAMPCKLVAKALATTRPFLKFSGTIDEPVTVERGRAVTFLADPNAQLTRGTGGAIITVRDDNTKLAIYDLAISNAPNNPNGFGIVIQAGGSPTTSLVRATLANNPAGAISAAGGALTVERSTIANNQGGGILASGGTLTVSRSTIASNRGGGISVTGSGVSFDITNTFIYRNGDNSSSTFGGLNLGIAVAGANRLAFNTIVDNEAAIGAGGVVCAVQTFMAPNNIIARNALAGSTTSASAQTTVTGCTYPSSRVQPDVVGLGFVHPDVPAPFDYKLAAGSSAIDQATTPVPIDVDNEGDARPQGAQKDIGADEYKP